MSVTPEQFYTKEDFSGYENPELYAKEFLPKVEKYRQALNAGILPKYSIKLPEDTEKLAAQQFNPLKYLYDQKLLTKEEFDITDSSSTELVKKIAAGTYTAVQVFEAYAKRGTICHQFTNCALELFPEEGLERAKFLDEYLAKNGKTIGPLHGLPISLKEQMWVKNKICHAGYVSRIDVIAPKHGTTAQILENLGAVFYVRTSQPQTLMHLDSGNNFIGFSKNPFNLSLSPGGSSSGEGSIVGFGGSAIGVGSDIGGSIRAPAAYSGCHGLRPTSKRIGLYGGFSSGVGQESVMAVAGPMTRSVDDIDLFMKHYINDGKPWEIDQNALRMPWRDVAKPAAKDLTIAVMYDDGLVKPTPPIQRGLKETVAKLEKAGVKIVEFKPIKTKEAYETVNMFYNCDGNYMQKKLLAGSGEPLCELTKWALNYGDGSKDTGVAVNRQLNATRDAIRQEYMEFLLQNDIDFILSPAYNNVAPQPAKVFNWSYTALFNLLDWPTLAFQTGLFQDPKVDKWDDSHKSYKFRSDLEKLELDNYDPEQFKNAPIGLQLSGRRYFDEEVVAAGRTIVDILGTDLYNLF